MRIYLDVSCLNRPFDDQSQLRVRLEAEAIRLILDKSDANAWALLSSEISLFEVNAIPDEERRTEVASLLPAATELIRITPEVSDRAKEVGTRNQTS
jgi:hypothetical protein